MNARSKKLIGKMCFVLKIVRQLFLIATVLSALLCLFFVFHKDIFSKTTIGSLRIDYLLLIFKNDLPMYKEKMTVWTSLILFALAVLFFIIYRGIRTTESICKITVNTTPFDGNVSSYLVRLAGYVLLGGMVWNGISVLRIINFQHTIDFQLLFNPAYVSKIDFRIHFSPGFLVVTALIYLLSHVFRYGQELQKLSDETL